MRLLPREFLFAVVAASMSADAVFAQAVFYDTFSTNGTLIGTTPNFGGAWTLTGTSNTNPITVSAGVVSLQTNGQDAYGAFTSSVAAATGTRLFTGLDINVTSAQSGGDYFLHVSDPAGTTTNFYQRLSVRSSGAGFQLGFANTSGGAVTTYGTDVLSFGQTYRAVVSWEFLDGPLNDSFNVYVNPADVIQSNNTPLIANYVWGGTTAEPTQLTAVNFRQGSNAAAPVLSADNLIVSNNFAVASALAPVPEPAGVLLAAAATLGAVRLGRRRFFA